MIDWQLLPRPRELADTGQPGARAHCRAEERSDSALPAEGYELEISPKEIQLRYADQSGLRYGRDTLRQLREQVETTLPRLRIRDWPDFPVRGYLLDVSRNRVPTRSTLEQLVERLLLLRINHLELYTEHSFAYRAHEVVWRDSSPITPHDIRWLDAAP